jgi:hypothetical protein
MQSAISKAAWLVSGLAEIWPIFLTASFRQRRYRQSQPGRDTAVQLSSSAHSSDTPFP